VTSEDLSKIFKVPIGVIIVHPCFRIEQSRVIGGRSSSEAWIKNFNDEVDARALAAEKTGMLLGTNKIQCEALLEPINEEELCESFQKGQCRYMDTCYYKHFICSQSDTCEDEYCWYGHSDNRTTISNGRLEYRKNEICY
jgi:hypothetical protein